MARRKFYQKAGIVAATAPQREHLIDEHEGAAILGLSVKTLRRWRWLKTGPPWYRIGAAIRYSPGDLDEFKAAGPRIC